MRCAVQNCTSSQRINNKEISFHRFPHIVDLKFEWIKALGLKPNLVHERSRVCSKHFFESDFIGKTCSSRRLFPSAVPCIDPLRNEIFPATLDLRHLWIYSLKLDEDMLTPNAVVCSKHFLESDYFTDLTASRRRLFPSAIPHLDDVVDETFPNTSDLKNKWLSALKVEKNLVTGVVCSNHFQDSDFIGYTKASRGRLFPSAVPHLDPADDFDNESVDPLCINNFVESLLEGIEDVKEQQEEEEQKEDEKQEEKEEHFEEENLQIIQNIQIVPPRNQNIESHSNEYTQGDPLPTFTLPLPIKISTEQKLQYLDKTDGESNKNINTQNILSTNTFQTSYNASLMSAQTPTIRAAPNEPGNQTIIFPINYNTPAVSAPLIHSLPAATKVLSESYNKLPAPSSRKTDQDKIRDLEFKLAKKNRKIVVLNQKLRRRTKRIKNLIQTIKLIKNNNIVNDETTAILKKCLEEDDLVEVLWS